MNQIWHGDSRKLVSSITEPINCLILDPPYGVSFKSYRAELPKGKEFVRPIEGDADLAGALSLFSEVFIACSEKTADNCDAYLFSRWDVVDHWIQLVRDELPIATGFRYKMLLIWDKGIPGMGDIDGNWGCGHEIILYLKKGRRDMPYRRSSIIAVNKLGAKQHIHPTEKPVKLMQELINISTEPGDLVVDPFSGSGSAVVAAQNLGRNAIGIETDLEHVRRSRERLLQKAMVFPS